MKTTDQRFQAIKALIRWIIIGVLAVTFITSMNVAFSCANQETAIRTQMKNSQIALTKVYSVFQTEGAIAEKDRAIVEKALTSGAENPFAIIQSSGLFTPDTQLMVDLKSALDGFSKAQFQLTQLGSAYQERLNRPIGGFIAHIEGFPHDGLNNPKVVVDPTAKKVHETGTTDWSSFK